MRGTLKKLVLAEEGRVLALAESATQALGTQPARDLTSTGRIRRQR